MKVKVYDGSVPGSVEVLTAIRKKRLPLMILLLSFSAFLLLLGVIGLIVENYVLFVIGMIFLLPFLIPGIIALVRYLKPMKGKPLSRHPEILQRADYLFANIVFQNDAVVVAPGYFAFKQDISMVYAMNEVLLIYKRIVNTNYGTTYSLIVETVRESVTMPYIKGQDAGVDESIPIVARGCQYAHLGYSKENLNYVEYMRTMWQASQEKA